MAWSTVAYQKGEEQAIIAALSTLISHPTSILLVAVNAAAVNSLLTCIFI